MTGNALFSLILDRLLRRAETARCDRNMPPEAPPERKERWLPEYEESFYWGFGPHGHS